MNRAIFKAIMLSAKLRNTLLKYPTTANRILYSKQRNVCLSLLWKEKKKYFANLNIKNITENKKLWNKGKFLPKHRESDSEGCFKVQKSSK